MTKTKVTPLADLAECQQAVLDAVSNAELRLAFFTQQLEPKLYNHRNLCELISALARKNRHSEVRIIAQHTKTVVSEGHCLIDLSQRLSSSMWIRTPTTPELQRFQQSWLIVDDHSIIEISNPERNEGKYIEHDRPYVRNQLEFFNDAWENSEADLYSRRLGF